jgi:transposase
VSGAPLAVGDVGSGMTCWRRLAEWHEAVVWQRLHEMLPAELHAADKLDWSKAVIDGSTYKRLRATDAARIPLAVTLTGGNRHGRHPAHARVIKSNQHRSHW